MSELVFSVSEEFFHMCGNVYIKCRAASTADCPADNHIVNIHLLWDL